MRIQNGIKGQKWGVRRFQNKDGSLTSAGKKRYNDEQDLNSNADTSTKKHGLTDKQKKILKTGAIIAGTALAVYGGYKLYGNYKGLGMDIDPETGYRLLKKPESGKDSLKVINPGKIRVLSTTKNTEIISGSSTNCMLCTTAFELRQRGYDVHAGFDTGGRGFFPDKFFPQIFKDAPATTKIVQSLDDIVDGKPYSTKEKLSRVTEHLNNMPNGSRGNIMVWWKKEIGGGHSMIWEKVDGKIRFMDGQTGQVYDNFAEQILKNTSDRKPIEILRTDNLSINTSSIKPYINSNTITKTMVDHGGEIALKTLSDPTIATIGMYGAIIAGSTYYSKKHSDSNTSTSISNDTTSTNRRKK